MKNTLLTLSVAGCLALPLSAPVWAAEQQPMPITAAAQKEEADFRLVNDTAGIYDATARMNEEENLKKIFSSANDKATSFRIYTFIYDSMNRGIPSVEEDLLSQADLGGNIRPIIFIYNTADKDYRFVIDERIEGYIPKSYLQNTAKETVLSKERPTSADFDELLDRASTMLIASANAGLGRQGDLESAGTEVDKSKFEIRDFGSVTVKKDGKEDKKAEAKKDDSSMTLAICAGLILVIVAGGIIFKMKQTKNKGSFGGR